MFESPPSPPSPPAREDYLIGVEVQRGSDWIGSGLQALCPSEQGPLALAEFAFPASSALMRVALGTDQPSASVNPTIKVQLSVFIQRKSNKQIFTICRSRPTTLDFRLPALTDGSIHISDTVYIEGTGQQEAGIFRCCTVDVMVECPIDDVGAARMRFDMIEMDDVDEDSVTTSVESFLMVIETYAFSERWMSLPRCQDADHMDREALQSARYFQLPDPWTFLQAALADNSSVDILPPRFGRDAYNLGIEIYDPKDETTQLLSLTELTAEGTLTLEGELAVVRCEGAWVADDDAVPNMFYQPVVNVFLQRRLDGKILTLVAEHQAESLFETRVYNQFANGHFWGVEGQVNLGQSQTLRGTGHGTPWKKLVLETIILCEHEPRTVAAWMPPTSGNWPRPAPPGAFIEQPGKNVVGVKIVLEDLSESMDWNGVIGAHTCTSIEELLHVVESAAFALRWA